MKRYLYLVIISLVTLLFVSTLSSANSSTEGDYPWGERSIINKLFMTANATYVESVQQMQTILGLSDEEMERIQKIAKWEAEELFQLKNESNALLQQVQTDEEKYEVIQNIEYNERLKKIHAQTLQQIYELLGPSKYEKFLEYLTQWWHELNDPFSTFNLKLTAELDSYLPDDNSISNYPYWISVYTTQYIGHSTDEVALPDKYIKFANLNYYEGGWPRPPSAYNNPPYFLPIRYNNSQVSKPILEVGPWNENDNYWRPNSGSTNNRRIYNALRALNNQWGVCDSPIYNLDRYYPQATAARNDNYFCGYDEFGRYTNAAGFDITPQVASQLGIGYLQNVWLLIDVSQLP